MSQLIPLLRQLKIRTEDQQLVPLEPNWAQTELITEVEKARDERRPARIITLKARRLGISTVSEALMYTWALTPNTNCCVVAHDREASEYLFGMAKLYHETFLDGEAKKIYPTRYATKRNMQWDGHGSTFNVLTAENVDAARSRTLHGLHCSEVGFWSDPTATMLALMQTIKAVPGTLIILESTANGVGNWFEETWTEAQMGKNDYVPLFFPWWRHPSFIPCHGARCTAGTCDVCTSKSKGVRPIDDEERDLVKLGVSKQHLAWRRWCLPNKCFNDEDLFRQEYPACVVGSTRVGTNRGIIPIEDVMQHDRATKGRVFGSTRQPESQIYRLTTDLGFELRGTWHHPIFLESGILVPLSHLKPGMTVKLEPPRMAEGYHEESWQEHGVRCSVIFDEDWGRLLGYFMSDGSLSGDTLSIAGTLADEDVTEDIERLFKTVLDLSPGKRVTGDKKGGVEVRAQSKRVKALFDRLGMLRRNGSGDVKRKVHVPEIIWCSPKPVVREFLKSLFEGDGFNAYKCHRVMFFSSHERFIHDVQLLLLAFGITSRIKRVRKKAGGDKHWYIGYEMCLRSEETKAFLREIGFVGERKNSRGPAKSRKNPPMTLTAQVVSVEEDGYEPTYDLTVEGGEAFDANGILTHNTPEEAFILSGVMAFPESQLKDVYQPKRPIIGRLVRGTDLGQVRFVPDARGPLRTYKMPDDKGWGRYFIGADPCMGHVDGDAAAAQVINRRSKEQVAVWHGRVNPIAFAEELAMLGLFYNRAMIAPEVEGGGIGTIARLIDIYPNLWHHRLPDRSPDRQIGATMGWSTNWKRKQWLVMKLAERIERGEITIHDAATYKELRTYSYYGTKGYGEQFGPADSKLHDDLVMALGIAIVCEATEPDLEPYDEHRGRGVHLGPEGVVYADGEDPLDAEAWG